MTTTRMRFNSLLLWLGMAIALAAVPARAEIASATGSTASRAVIGTSSAINVEWRVTVFNATPDRSTAVISSEAYIALDGDVSEGNAVRIPQPLKRLLPPTAGPATQTAVFRENIVVPAELTDLALAAGRRLVIVRQFRDQNTVTPATATADVMLGGGNTARLSLSRAALRFPDGTQDKILSPDARSYVLADISYTGSGRFDAVWEVAEPTSTAGQPFFRTLSAVNRQLVGGLRNLTLRSPALPTTMQGLHLLRLRVISPAAGEGPVIQYYVNRELRSAPAPVRLFAYSPGEGAVYTRDTSFRWSPVPRAAVYQLEFFAKTAPSVADRLPELGSLTPDDRPRDAPEADERYPLTGVMVTGISTQTSLSQLSLSHLPQGQSYEWRITAYDTEGQLIGVSTLRSLTILEETIP